MEVKVKKRRISYKKIAIQPNFYFFGVYIEKIGVLIFQFYSKNFIAIILHVLYTKTKNAFIENVSEQRKFVNLSQQTRKKILMNTKSIKPFWNSSSLCQMFT